MPRKKEKLKREIVQRGAKKTVEWSKWILLGLLETGEEALILYFSTPYKGVAMLPKGTVGYFQARRRLEENGYISGHGKSNKYKLTSKGKAKALSLSFGAKAIVRELRKVSRQKIRAEHRSWDGKWRIIVFNIPETRRADRDFLRRQLQLIGFMKLDKGSWLFPYPFPTELRQLLDVTQLNSRCRLIVADSIEEDGDLRWKFGLGRKRKPKKIKISRT